VRPLADSDLDTVPPEPARVEAAVWLARLHSDTRTQQTEAGFRRWLAADAAHRTAFERMNGVWEATANLRRDPLLGSALTIEFWQVFHRNVVSLAVTLVICALFSVFVLYLMRSGGTASREGFNTAFGERRSILLSDGSRLVLNTDSRVRVAFSARARTVLLEKGQARFEVVRDPLRPFVVRAAERQIVATGTSFDVRWTDDRLCIVLVEGHVVILPASAPMAVAIASTLTLDAGERMEFRGRTAVKSAARLDREEAWTTGHVIFDSTRLSAAIVEMNRYASRRLKLEDPALGDLLISGTFSVDDSRDFARAVAQVFALKMTADRDVILLGAAPK
jgi:transmembrane sensor